MDRLKKLLRYRTLFVLLGTILVLGLLFGTDPDGGQSTFMMLLSLGSGVLAVAMAFVARRVFFDEPDANIGQLLRRAGEHPTGAGLALVAIALVIVALLLVFSPRASAQDVRTYIPPAADEHLPALVAEIDRWWPDHPYRAYFGGLIEHESCISLRHSRCWNPTSRLKTAREEGAGLGQITRAYRVDGTLRFDALQEMRDRHAGLRELTWANVYRRPDLQVRAVVLKSRDDYRTLARVVNDPMAALAFADAAYNGGLAGVQKERRACGLRDDCDPQRWFSHVEHVCLKSRQPLYGNRSACDINRAHVRDTLLTRAPKYEARMS